MYNSIIKAVYLALPFTYLLLSAAPVAAQQTPAFAGEIQKDIKDSKAAWPAPTLPPKKAPNVLIWMIDDAGFGHLGPYGSKIETPNLDQLASVGVRYNNFHATPVCSASRATLLTGRNPHRSHVGAHAGASVGFPGYDAHKPDSIATIASMLKEQGYVTYALGKWDHLPTEDTTPAGPFEYWPSGQGFDRFYGFLAADSDNFQPTLWQDHTPVKTPNAPNYHLTTDMADKAIDWIAARDAMPDKVPFFMYWATGAVHAPHHAPKEYIDHYRGRFDEGWDAMREHLLTREINLGIVPTGTPLPPRPEGMQPWANLSAKEKKSYARAMEAFAAQLTHADEQFGRIIQYLRHSGELENTLVIVTSDNGASAEGGVNGTHSEHMFFNGFQATVEENLNYYDSWGGPETYPHVPMGWAVAGNTPFRYYKQTAYEGGSRVPLIISWPEGIAQAGAIRNQYHFISDIAPTILAAAQLPFPNTVNHVAQEPFDGVDMRYSFNQPDAPSPRRIQYYDTFGNRAIYADGWKAVNKHRVKTWDLPEQLELDDSKWELYNLNNDFSELTNLADESPQKLTAMIDLFDQEAKKNQVYPIISTPMEVNKLIKEIVGQRMMARGALYVYKAPIARLPEIISPPLNALPYELTASINLSSAQAGTLSGPIFAIGGRHGGMSLYLADGKVKYLYHNVEGTKTVLDSNVSLPEGDSTIQLVFDKNDDSGGDMTMRINGKDVASNTIPGPLPNIFTLHETFDIGSDTGTLVSQEYAASPEFEGQLNELRIQLKLPLIARMLMKLQGN